MQSGDVIAFEADSIDASPGSTEPEIVGEPASGASSNMRSRQ